MKTYTIEFVIAGTRQLRTTMIPAASEQAVLNWVSKKFGIVDYFKFI